MIVVKLSPAAVSAIECADLEAHHTIRQCFDARGVLAFDPDTRGTLIEELIDAANSEDATAQQSSGAIRQMCRSAADSLTTIARAVRRAQ